MGIFSRMSDIVNANLNNLLEKAEDPDKIIRLMIQEMEDTLVEVRSSAARSIAEKKERQRHLKFLIENVTEWEHKAELALRKDREDLAKAALTEKAKINDHVEILNKELNLIDEQLSKLNQDISQLQAKLDDAKARQRSITMRHKAAQSQVRVRRQIHDSRLDDVLHRFEVAEKRIDSMESQAESISMGRSKGLAEEIADLETDERIEDEFEQLKARIHATDKKSSKDAK